MDIILASGHNRSRIYTLDSHKRADMIQDAWLHFLTTKTLTENEWGALVDHSSYIGRDGRVRAARECARYGHDLVGVPHIGSRICRRCCVYQ